MKRACIATGMVVALVVVVLGGPASAGERRRTATAQYRGHSEAALIIGSSGTSARTRFAVPSWARSVRISIHDDTDRPVVFLVYFNDGTGDDYRFANSGSCVQRATLNLRGNTKRISVARPLAVGCGATLVHAAGIGTHTTGVVKATFSSKPTTTPSPRHYVGGCSAQSVSGIGFGYRCSYKASRVGGYLGAGTWHIEIVRARRTIDLEATKDPHCSETGFIHPGDFVTVETGGGFGAGYVAAGDDVHC